MPHKYKGAPSGRISASVLTLALLLAPSAALAQSLQSFAILGGSTITNTGTSTVNGNIGLSPGLATTGTGPAGADQIVLTGTLHIGDGVAIQAKSDLTTAFNVLMGRPSTSNLTGETLGSLGTVTSLNAGVYNFDTSAQLSGALTLNGTASDVFIFQIGSTLITDPGSSIVLGGTVSASNVFFVVGSSATLDTTTAFAGQILALTSITMNNSATINCGAAWARNGAVTMNTNTIGICTFAILPGTFGSALDGTGTPTQLAVRDAINDFLDGGGELPLAFEVLALLTPEELAAALDQLSGEVNDSAGPAGNQSMNSLLDLALGNRSGAGTVVVPDENPPNSVSVMGYAAENQPAEGSALGAMEWVSSAPDIDQWTIWAAGYGGYSLYDGDLPDGSHDTTITDAGLAVGFERNVSTDLTVGLALSIGATEFALSDDLGSGHSGTYQAALYGRKDFDNAYVSMALAYGLNDVTTDRFVTVGGVDHFRSQFLGHDLAADIEAGYKLGAVTPYLALRGQAYLTPAYEEQTISGSETFALAYEPGIVLTGRTEVGVRVEFSNDFEGGVMTLNGGVALAHSKSTTIGGATSFQALPGSPFNIDGAAASANSILVSAGIAADFDNGYSLGGSFDGALAADAQTYGASMRLGYSW